MSWRDTLATLGEDTAERAGVLYARWQDGQIDDTFFVAALAALIARANHRATSAADLALAATLTLQLHRPVLPLGITPPPDEADRLTTAASTLLAALPVVADPLARVLRLARSEPIAAAQRAYNDAMRASTHVTGWTRQVSPGACELCQALAGDVLPVTVEMFHHPGCTCTAVPVTE